MRFVTQFGLRSSLFGRHAASAQMLMVGRNVNFAIVAALHRRSFSGRAHRFAGILLIFPRAERKSATRKPYEAGHWRDVAR